MVLLEAAACALHAVATNIPGTREVIVPGQTGSLATADSATALAEAMTALMQAPLHERQAMGECARHLVIEQFSLAAVLERWEALYNDLLKHNPKPTHWARNCLCA